MSVARYLHFLLALAGALLAAFCGALVTINLLLLDWLRIWDVDLPMVLTAGSTPLAALAFWLLGRGDPLKASAPRTAWCAAVAGAGFYLVSAYGTRAAWLTGGPILLGSLLALATLGYLPFVGSRRD